MIDLAATATREWRASTANQAMLRAASAHAMLRTQLRRPVDSAMARWADRIADTGGDTPLLATGLRAARYEALLWNGARHHRDPHFVTALLTAPTDTSTTGLGRAVLCADAVSATAWAAIGDGPATADVATLGCAVAAALVGTAGLSDVAAVIDVAASLMSIAAARGPDGAEHVALLRAGHPAAAGWLACQTVTIGFTGIPAAADTTLAAVSGGMRGDAPPPTVHELVASLP